MSEQSVTFRGANGEITTANSTTLRRAAIWLSYLIKLDNEGLVLNSDQESKLEELSQLPIRVIPDNS